MGRIASLNQEELDRQNRDEELRVARELLKDELNPPKAIVEPERVLPVGRPPLIGEI